MAQDQIAKLMAAAGRTNDGAGASDAIDTHIISEIAPPSLPKSATQNIVNDAPSRRVARRRPAGPLLGRYTHG